MDLYLYYEYKNRQNEKFSDQQQLTKSDYCLIVFELIGLIIGICLLIKCKKNLVYNIVIYLFSPWLFIILHCYTNSCGIPSYKSMCN